MEWVAPIALVIVLTLSVIWLRVKRRHSGVKYGTVNYLIPGEDDEPLTPREVFVSGVNRVGVCGEHRQSLIAKLRKGEPIFLVRQPNNEYDSNAVILYAANGKDIGFLPRELAKEIAPRLDKGSPVTATVSSVERFDTEEGKRLLGVRLRLVPHKLRRATESKLA